MVYTNYTTIYDDTEASRSINRNVREPTADTANNNNNSNHYAHMHYEYTTRVPQQTPKQQQQQQQHIYENQNHMTNGAVASLHRSRSSAQQQQQLQQQQSDAKRYRSQINLHTKGGGAGGGGGGGKTDGFAHSEYFIPTYSNGSNPLRRSTSAHTTMSNARNSLSRKLDILDAKYSQRLRHHEPIIEETSTSTASNPMYPAEAYHHHGVANRNGSYHDLTNTALAASSSSSSAYRFYDVEIPIQRARGTYHFDAPMPPQPPGGHEAYYQYYEPPSKSLPSSSTDINNHYHKKQPTLKLDVEIFGSPNKSSSSSNNESSEASRKSKSYEVRLVLIHSYNNAQFLVFIRTLFFFF